MTFRVLKFFIFLIDFLWTLVLLMENLKNYRFWVWNYFISCYECHFHLFIKFNQRSLISKTRENPWQIQRWKFPRVNYQLSLYYRKIEISDSKDAPHSSIFHPFIIFNKPSNKILSSPKVSDASQKVIFLSLEKWNSPEVKIETVKTCTEFS